MTSLYNRATPSQARIFRAVEGAVKNAADAHPEYKIDRRFCRSAAKRAAGTLTAQWADVLAAKLSSETAARLSACETQPAAAQLPKRNAKGGVTLHGRRSPFRRTILKIGAMAGQARRDGDTKLEAALVDILRFMAARSEGEG